MKLSEDQIEAPCLQCKGFRLDMLLSLYTSIAVRRSLFLGFEHAKIGDKVQFNFTLQDNTIFTFDGSQGIPLPQDGEKVTYGDLVALCGDYYAPGATTPICAGDTEAERKSRWMKMWSDVGNERSSPGFQILFPGLADKADVARSQNMIAQTMSEPTWLIHISNNIDHFMRSEISSSGPLPESPTNCGCWEAYTVGHNIALEAAKAATQLKGTNSLENALLQNACASHYLSDAFASGTSKHMPCCIFCLIYAATTYPGHIRTPAQNLFNFGNNPSYSVPKQFDGGINAMSMHDFDNK